MTRIFVLLLLVFCAASLNAQESIDPDTIVISGIVSDFDNVPVDSAFVEIKHPDFSTAYKAYSDKNGRYEIRVRKGKYLALAAIKHSEYPLLGSVLPKDEQRLEFWCWNLIANENLAINVRYNRLEVYGVNVFHIYGASRGYTIYCRPMSLTRAFDSDKELSHTDLCPDPDELLVAIRINGEPVKVNMKEKVREYVSQGICFGYLIHVDLPRPDNEKPYDILQIEMQDKKTGDKGEAFYFIEKGKYN